MMIGTLGAGCAPVRAPWTMDASRRGVRGSLVTRVVRGPGMFAGLGARAGERARARGGSSSRLRASASSSSSSSSSSSVDASKKTTGKLSQSPSASLPKSVYTFGNGHAEGDKSMKSLLGGKGANLAEMSRVGLSVPPGFTVTTSTCASYHDNARTIPPSAWDEMLAGVAHIEGEMGFGFGDAAKPLLVSVRSGAAVSMPGMMDTILNLGLNDDVVEGLAVKSGSARFAYDSYRRLLDMYGSVVMGIEREKFEHALTAFKASVGVARDEDLSESDLRGVCDAYKAIYAEENLSFPQDPYEQLRLATHAVFDSWQSDRAKKYMAINQIVGVRGTAVNVQAMVFGNMGQTSGTGVLFTRNPSTGENVLYGEYLVNAQGEDVVAGIRTPEDISTMERALPDAYADLVRNTQILEREYGDMQDIEFTVQESKLYMLQCRSGKRTGAAAVKIAVDLVNEGACDERRAITLVEPTHVDQLLHPQFKSEESYKANVIGTGLPASPGAAVGRVVFCTEDAEAAKARGEPSILVRAETSPEDVGGMNASEGILTARGGMTSHAAVVARGWGKPCVSGCGDISIDEHAKTFTLGGVTVKQGDWISLNGSTGQVILGAAELAVATQSEYLETFMSWVDKFRTMRVLANADTPADAAASRANGAEGIGLVRTEHMFFGTGERIRAVRRMILAKDTPTRKSALDDLLPYQREDFTGIFKAMSGLPVTVRLLDPPLHEFLPEGGVDEVCQVLSEDTGESEEDIAECIEKLAEVNPMLGFRGCRLAITFPEIAEMQVRAIMEAACDAKRDGADPVPEIMIPLVGTVEELKQQTTLVRAVTSKVFAERGMEIAYKVGTMIEIPRAALLADEISAHADFFSFGTNDLTQMTFGYSRDDVGKFLPSYIEKGILKYDPFEVIDRKGVGKLVTMTVDAARSTPTSAVQKCGICGEHGGDPQSIEFFQQSGLDYVSCSPFRVLIARLAAAQAAVKGEDAAK